MQTAIIIYLAIYLILNLFFKIDKSKCYCGIAAFSAAKNITEAQERLVAMKMRILGLYNQSRGTHGCGLFINNQIIKGYDNLQDKVNTKKFEDFIANRGLIIPAFESKTNPNIILHARHATYGAQVEANNHPFYIQSENEKNDMVLAHNGTIENIWDLCKTYGLKNSDYNVDSKALGALIDKVGVEEALTKYKGFAALVWTKPNDNGSLYVYHGASRRLKNDTVWEERPLMYMHTEEGTYFSSMEESLLAIRETETQVPYDVDHNTVFKITNGKFTSYKKHIPREDANLYTYTPAAVHKPAQTFHGSQNQIGFSSATSDQQVREIAAAIARNANVGGPDFSLIMTETALPKSEQKDKTRIFFHKGRYWFPGPILVNGEQYLNCKGFLDDKGTNETKSYFFYAGVLLNGPEAFRSLTELQKDPKSWLNYPSANFAYCMSRFADQPVTNFETEFKEIDDVHTKWWKYAFYDNGHRATKNFSPKFSSRTYIFKNAFLISITTSDKNDSILFETEALAPKIIIEGTIPSVSNCKIGARRIINPKTTEDSVFDMVFTTMQEAIQSIANIEKQAMLEFIEEDLSTKISLEPTKEEIEANYAQSLREAISTGKTMRQILEDTTSTLEMYMSMIEDTMLEKEPKVGATKKQIEAWEEEFYHLNGYYPGKANFQKDDSSVHQDEVIEENDTDEALEDNFSSEEDQDINLDMTKERLDMIIDQLAMLDETAEELRIIDGDLAQEFASTIFTGIDSLKHNLAEVLVKHNEPQIAQILNQKVKSTL